MLEPSLLHFNHGHLLHLGHFWLVVLSNCCQCSINSPPKFCARPCSPMEFARFSWTQTCGEGLVLTSKPGIVADKTVQDS